MQRSECLPGVIVRVLNYSGSEDGRRGTIIPYEDAAKSLDGRELALMRDSKWIPVLITEGNVEVVITFPPNRLDPI